MTRQLDDKEDDVSGGHAAERLREFMAERFPGGLPREGAAANEDSEDETGESDEGYDPSRPQRG
jgi:hypothetical protein